MPLTVRDPVHGSIRLDDWARPLVDHPEFQRLRRIAQLGTANLVYPGAHHRRFEHSLGAHHLAGRLAEALGLDEADALTVRAGALLHDVGHGPFSHAFEELMKEEGRRHEDVSLELVEWGPMADLLRQGGIRPPAVAELITGRGPLAKLVSGPVDADRMDYLLRDAHYTGVKSSADPDRLLRVLERHPDHGVVLRESGVLSAEALLTMRFLMYPAVYLHHTVRASESMLLSAIRAAVEAEGWDLKDLERETDDGLLHRLRAAGGTAAELVRRLDERRLYKRAWEERPEALRDGLRERLVGDGRARLEAARDIADRAGVPEHHVLVDVPKPPTFREVDLMVRRRDGAIVPLMEASQLVRVFQEARHDHWRAWVFSPRPDVEAVGAAARAVLG